MEQEVDSVATSPDLDGDVIQSTDAIVDAEVDSNAVDASAESAAAEDQGLDTVSSEDSVEGGAEGDDDGEEGEGGTIERSVAGPSEFSVADKRGRGRRIGNDVKYDDIDYKNIKLIGQFVDREGRILSRRKTRVSAKVQRRVAKEIKRARHLALLPYTGAHSRIVRKRGGK